MLERLLNVNVRQNISRAQHVYFKGRSVETALHKEVNFVEKCLQYGEYTMVTFLDVETTFNNISIPRS